MDKKDIKLAILVSSLLALGALNNATGTEKSAPPENSYDRYPNCVNILSR